MENQQVWFVTGASKGLGLVLVQQLLKAGHQVAATSRTKQDLITATGSEQSENFLPLEVTLTNEESVKNAISATVAKFTKIDVVVNNAGYGQVGTLEELSDSEARRNFDVNVFGSLNVIRYVMPHFRAQHSGKIFNIASVGGFFGNFPGWGIYCATKFAVAGFTESLAAEVKPFGISATVVYPGYFRTNFLSKESLTVPANPIPEYTEVRAGQEAHENEINGNQAGDPEKGAEVLIRIASEQNVPVHLFLGQDAYDMAALKIKTIESDLENWKDLATSTNFDN
ncbi:SDR family NAD(P)-dependent oxidoreductase [Dyadobacter sp. CY345]|uniref:SDR family NAD(P)-dependent oxidoreductase n=1 Tax=Dyadobacter sp. CY345 TaxID=2909335 RepID=UPI001F29AF96|nr:SDR family NAD(P)-dependent oxidoreductase [Dyadobacter sp. CY345]MCF2444086.1 SDR family NAD(P)-dependent oxidoreductase [Dyadobacter sp. CY345]